MGAKKDDNLVTTQQQVEDAEMDLKVKKYMRGDGANLQIDDVISQAQSTKAALSSQRTLFSDVGGKVKQLSDKFPVIRGLIGYIEG